MSSAHSVNYFSWRNLAVLAIPSLAGLFLFMTPIPSAQGLTIPVAMLANWLKTTLGDAIPMLLTVLVVSSALATLGTKLFQPAALLQRPLWQKLFNPSWIWLFVRLLGAALIVMVYSGVGPAFVISKATGALVFNDLLPVLLCVFVFAGLLLPLLLNFGLLEMVGTLMSKIMRPVFRLPGRSAVDCIASWLGDGSVGILLTSKQYEAGFYTAREAAVIGTTFSAVSVTFCLVVLGQVKLEHMFVPFYATICLAGIVAAIIVPRLPPLNRKSDTYLTGTDQMVAEGGHFSRTSIWARAFSHGLHRASMAPGVGSTIKEGLETVLDMLLGVLPVIMAVGSCALILAEYTPLFSYLGAPFVPVFELLQIPFASEASKSVMVGFADMFVPSILISTVPNEMTRFVIAALSVTQLIYMSEVGALLLGSRIPVTLLDLLLIFLLRTIVTLPVIAGMAHLLF
ncbi:YjiH family protein [Rheinheimera riviphila]|uniref:YjiH family protein n=1 Tax=Rheinheimera riviphila TaxID=1834037 RepID=A0A437R263_9GAMM|nr:YjiH family protein [Rheinheimera riviphila]RVU40874.1 YjiH family protein [Rheinheimera riviphila]